MQHEKGTALCGSFFGYLGFYYAAISVRLTP